MSRTTMLYRSGGGVRESIWDGKSLEGQRTCNSHSGGDSGKMTAPWPGASSAAHLHLPSILLQSIPSLGPTLAFLALCTLCSRLYLRLLHLLQPPCSLPVCPSITAPCERDLVHKGSFQARSHCDRHRRAVLSSAALFRAFSPSLLLACE